VRSDTAGAGISLAGRIDVVRLVIHGYWVRRRLELKPVLIRKMPPGSKGV
jgi:hypothetical protein